MKKNNYFIFFLLMLAFCIYSCATVPQIAEPEKPEEITPPAEVKKAPTPTEEETKSLELFTEVLELVESNDDRKSVLPKIEELYDKIIRLYPDAPLAQESYWKLITIYVDDYSPPDYEKAEVRYREFLEKYPESFMRGFIEDTIGNSYYNNSEWNRLLKLSAPAYQEYVKNGKQPRASMVFMYSEANYNLGNIEEARKGYEIVTKLFPKLIVGINSKKMLQKIEDIDTKNKN